MKKIRIHPLFVLSAAIFVIDGKFLLFLDSVIAVLLHEAAHCLSAKNKGYSINKLTLAPYGAILSVDTGLADRDSFFVCAAGPVCSLALSLSTVALWWIFPAAYPYTADFFKANLTIGVFNLLPLYPLDGGRMLLSAAKDKARCLKILKVLSYTVAAFSLVLFVVSVFREIAYSLFLVAAMLIFGCFTDGKREKYALALKRAYFLKDYRRPLVKRQLAVSENVEIKFLLKELRGDALYSVEVLREGKSKQVLEDEDLEKMFFFDREKTIKEFLKNRL